MEEVGLHLIIFLGGGRGVSVEDYASVVAVEGDSTVLRDSGGECRV